MAEAVEPRRRSVLCASPAGLHRIAYREWGDPRNRDVLLCVHGLTRSGRDFDELARALCAQFRIVCPDLAGRGDSDRLADPKHYTWAQYVADTVTLIARLDVEAVSWLGTSMGGFVGMALAAQPGNPVRRLILNDAAPVIAKAALERIATYVGQELRFATLAEAEKYVRTISAPFGRHSDAQWRFLAETWVRRAEDGSFRPHYDTRIAEAYRATMPEKDLELWHLYDAVRCPTLLVRGEQSDLVSRQTAAEMARRGPKARLAEIRGVGHAPTLLQPEQIALVRDFLLEGEMS
ncbi:MAG TPA: alpha/beta hydrolase [Burkholderiales bacterium]|nr:alpha/beta hydrolase [Burkholderiales bacterium]